MAIIQTYIMITYAQKTYINVKLLSAIYIYIYVCVCVCVCVPIDNVVRCIHIERVLNIDDRAYIDVY